MDARADIIMSAIQFTSRVVRMRAVSVMSESQTEVRGCVKP
jgi:hypothetical protein